MANWVIVALNELVNTVKGASIKLRDILEYKTTYSILDLPDNGLVTKAHLLSMAGGSGGEPVIIQMPAGSPYPNFIVDMSDPIFANISANPLIQVEELGDVYADAENAWPVYDIKVQKVYTDTTRTVMTVLNITGRLNPESPDEAQVTIDNIQILLL